MRDIYVVPFKVKDNYFNVEYHNILFTDKEFWEENHYVCDGPGDSLLAAFSEIGLEEATTAVLEWCSDEEMSIDKIKQEMKNRGFNLLIDDPKFIKEYIQQFGEDPRNTVEE